MGERSHNLVTINPGRTEEDCKPPSSVRLTVVWTKVWSLEFPNTKCSANFTVATGRDTVKLVSPQKTVNPERRSRWSSVYEALRFMTVTTKVRRIATF
jgi:hypothetical protein